MAILAAALNDPDRSLIGNPRNGSYAVSFKTKELTTANQLAKYLTRLELEARTNVRYDAAGEPSLAFVAICRSEDQRRLFEIVEGELDPDRRRRLQDLVLARGPIPEDLLKRISDARKRGWSPKRIAAVMNELGIITGMGGIHWTPRKVTAALAEYKENVAKLQAAA